MTADDHLRQTLAALTDHLRDSVTQEIQNVATTIATWQDIRLAAMIEAAERLRHAVHAIDRAGSLTEILDALAGAAAKETSRVAVLLVRDGQLRTFRTAGFGISDAVDPLALPIENDESDCAVVPLVIQGHAIGLLYADHGSGPALETTTQSTLDVLARHASRALEALTAIRTAQLIAGRGRRIGGPAVEIANRK